MAANTPAAPGDWAADDDYAATLMQALAIPPGPGFRPLRARVEHLLAPRQGPVAQVVTEALALPQVRWPSGCSSVHADLSPCCPARVAQPAHPTTCTCALQGAAELLLRFGAIHTCPVPPPTPPAVLEGLPPEEAQRLLARRAEALQRAGNSVSRVG